MLFWTDKSLTKPAYWPNQTNLSLLFCPGKISLTGLKQMAWNLHLSHNVGLHDAPVFPNCSNGSLVKRKAGRQACSVWLREATGRLLASHRLRVSLPWKKQDFCLFALHVPIQKTGRPGVWETPHDFKSKQIKRKYILHFERKTTHPTLPFGSEHY